MNMTSAEYFTFNVDYSLLLIGQSGTGKSFLVNRLLQQYIDTHTAETLRLFIMDMKGVDFNQLQAGNINHIEKFVQFDAASGLDVLEEIYTLMVERIAQKTISPLLFIVIEECDMAALDQKRFDACVTKINRAAKLANTKIIYITSSPRESVVSSELIESFDLILFGELPGNDYERLKLPKPSIHQPYEFGVHQTKVKNTSNN